MGSRTRMRILIQYSYRGELAPVWLVLAWDLESVSCKVTPSLERGPGWNRTIQVSSHSRTGLWHSSLRSPTTFDLAPLILFYKGWSLRDHFVNVTWDHLAKRPKNVTFWTICAVTCNYKQYTKHCYGFTGFSNSRYITRLINNAWKTK